MIRGPLTGVRVADFGQLTAGANAAAMLADLGADVIKIESAGNPDLFRSAGSADREPGWWDRSTLFQFTNRNKRGVSIDAKTAEGRRVALALASRCDVVVENFRRGVLERMGLDFPSLAAINPAIVLASISSQGETGPNRSHVSYGSTLEAMGGLSAATGYAGGAPEISGSDVNYPDQVVSLFATGIIIAAVEEARRCGRGVHLDIAQREVVTFLLGEQVVAAGTDRGFSMVAPRGNEAAGTILQDCFLCSDDRWLAITIADEQAEHRLAVVLEQGESMHSRLKQFCRARDAHIAAAELTALGICGQPVLTGLDLLHSPAITGRTLATAPDGTGVKGAPYHFRQMPLAIARPAPKFGEHTSEVLREIVGLPAEAIERLQALGVTADIPRNRAAAPVLKEDRQ